MANQPRSRNTTDNKQVKRLLRHHRQAIAHLGENWFRLTEEELPGWLIEFSRLDLSRLSPLEWRELQARACEFCNFGFSADRTSERSSMGPIAARLLGFHVDLPSSNQWPTQNALRNAQSLKHWFGAIVGTGA